MYFYQPRTGRFERSSRTIRASTVGPAPRRGFEDDMLYVPHRAPSRAKYDSSANEYSTQADINRELVMSANTMEDNYVLSNKSRQRDRDVLAAANRAIVDTEIHSSPRSAVASRRVMRGRSMPPAPVTHYARPEVPVAFARASPNKLRYSVPPASAPSPRSRYPRVVVKPRYRNFVPVRSTRGLTSSTGSEGQRRAPLSYLAYLRNLESVLMNKRSRASTFVPVRTVKKAALLASKVDTMLPTRVRRPKSKYAQEKLRQIRRDKRESGEAVDPVAVLPLDESRGLKASPPVYTPPIATKPMYDGDGMLKKPNIMSWQYRLDSYLSPDDLIITPRSLGSVKKQLRLCQEKMDRHKQLMERYLVTDKGLTPEEQQELNLCKAYLEKRVY